VIEYDSSNEQLKQHFPQYPRVHNSHVPPLQRDNFVVRHVMSLSDPRVMVRTVESAVEK
jgi:hypothetical protein